MQKEKYKFSVIIPIYNAEKYLKETIDSVINQTIGFKKNIQLILVNDGSTDNSEKICIEYKEKYPENVTYIKQKNSGASFARNVGMEYIEGRYVNFLDSDDKWQQEAFDKVWDFFENNQIDIIACRRKFFEGREDYHNLDYIFEKDRIINITENYECIHLHAASTFFKAYVVKKYQFDVNLRYGEDAKFVSEILIDIKKYGVLRNALYYYRKRIDESSILQNSYTDIRWYAETIENFHEKLIEESIKKNQKVLPYIQYVIMYDLKARIKKKIYENLDENTKKRYKDLVINVLQKVEDYIICEQKKCYAKDKIFTLSLKYGRDIVKELEYKKGKLYFNNISILSIKDNETICRIESIYTEGNFLVLEGLVKIALPKDEYDIYIKVNQNKSIPIKFIEECETKNEPSDFSIGRKIMYEYRYKNKILIEDIENIKFTFKYKNNAENTLSIDKKNTDFQDSKYSINCDNNKIVVNKNNKKLIKNENWYKTLYKKWDWLILYTLLFLFVFSLIYWFFIKTGKSFIWNQDGMTQHYVFLKDFNQIIRKYIANIKGGLPLFSWDMGLGLDIIGQYSYYIIGDPFAYLSLLFPMNKLDIAYTIIIALRIYLVGVSFILYCRYNKKRTINSILGAFIYTFSAFLLFAAVRHPYFTNAMIWLPLMFLGIDKLLKENKKSFLIFSSFIATISNYYFFYMLIILTIIYAIVKYICEQNEKNIKDFLKKFGIASFCIILGVLMASAILLPTIYAFLNSSRTSSDINVTYDITDYARIATNLISFNVTWNTFARVTISVAGILFIPLMFLRKDRENKTYKYLFVIFTIMILSPKFQSIMNGFSYPSNRWTFGYAFVLAYAFVQNYNVNLKYNKKELKSIIIFVAIYISFILFICSQFIKINKCTYINSIYMLAMLFMIVICNWSDFLKNKQKYKVILMCLLIIGNIVYNGKYINNLDGGNYATEFVEMGEIEQDYKSLGGFITNFKKSIDFIKKNDKSLYRIIRYPNYRQNASLLYNFKTINSYTSLGSKYAQKLNAKLGGSPKDYYIKEVENRARITTLLGSKYFICDNSNAQNVPYGYSLYKKIGKTQIYLNNFNLPLGVLYDNYITTDQFNQLSPLEKEVAYTKTAVIDNKKDITNYRIPNSNNLIENIKNNIQNKIQYSIIDKNKIVKQNNQIETKENNQSIKLKVDEIKNSELYVVVHNLSFEPFTKQELIKDEINQKSTKMDIEKIKEKYKYYIPSYEYSVTVVMNNISRKRKIEDKKTSAYYRYDPEIYLSLGYINNFNGEIEIKFNNKGKYKFDSIEILSIDMSKYEEDMKNLQKNQMQIIKYNNNYVKGKIKTEKQGILQFSTTYSDGWKAYVDGKKVEKILINTAFIGVPLEKGEHEIYFKYETPYLRIGIIFTFISFGIYFTIIIYEKNVIKKKYEEY